MKPGATNIMGSMIQYAQLCSKIPYFDVIVTGSSTFPSTLVLRYTNSNRTLLTNRHTKANDR